MDQERIPRTLEERTVRFTKDQLTPAPRIPCLNLPDLKETAAYTFRDTDEYLLVECEPEFPMKQCPVCKKHYQVSKNGYTQYPRLIHDVNVGLQQVDLSVKVPKYVCKSCNAVFTHEFDSFVEGRQFTKRLYEQIKVDSFYRKFTEVAEEFGISDTTVADIFDEYTFELEAHRQAPEVGTWLAIDEKHVNHKMRGVFVDGDSGRLLELTEDNSLPTVKKAIMSFKGYENVKFVTTDMANSYRTVIEDIYGSSVTMIVDKWHVLHDLSTKISKCRSAIIEYLGTEIKKEEDETVRKRKLDVKKLATDNGYLFKFGDEKLIEKPIRLQILSEVCKTFPEFNHLRLLKEGFELIYDCQDRESAEQVFDQWCDLVPPSGKKQIEAWEAKYKVRASLFDDIRSLKTTVNNRWRREIFNYFDTDAYKTNAIAEATNSFIERSVINGYSFKRLRAKVLFWHTAGARKRYVIDLRKQLDTSSLQHEFFTPGHSHTQFQYKDVYGIYEVEEVNKHKPLNVLSFLPDDKKKEFVAHYKT